MRSMSSLSLYAGPKALRQIQSEGLHSEQFKVLVGASGGPKWFVLYGLDRFLFGDFFANRETPLAALGSSAGAWRMGCLATADPVAAIDRLARLYSSEQYTDNPTTQEVTDKARLMLQEVLGANGAAELIANETIRLHIIAGRCRGLLSRDSKSLLGVGLALAATSNVLSRRLLSLYFDRVVFNNHEHACEMMRLRDLRTVDVKLSQQNVHQALIASGSIPFILSGERNIHGAPDGLYLDGGITDYHFDLPFHVNDGLVLYPHFYPRVVPGWFDKALPWRRVDKKHYDNVLLVVPSAEFVARLPYQKIPDRSDFAKMDYGQRFKYWQTVLAQSTELADDFAQLVATGEGLQNIKLFNPSQTGETRRK